MIDDVLTDLKTLRPRWPARTLVGLGVVAVLLAGSLAVRIVWEETILTLRDGPQMIGFSLAHGAWGILLVTPVILAAWLVFALGVLVISLWRKRTLSRWYWVTFASAVVVMSTLSLPGTFWQWMLISHFAKTAHAADLMCSAAAEGNPRTVSGYIAHGVSIEATNYEGSTAAFCAAAGGRVPVLEVLVSKGAKLNATNSYGDSPLEAAMENHNQEAVQFLRSHGASQLKGTEEQRQGAAHAFVMKEMYRNVH